MFFNPGSSRVRVLSVLGLVSFLVFGFGCVGQEKYRKALSSAEHFKEAYESLHAYQTELESRNRDLETRLAQVQLEGAGGRAVYQEASVLRDEYQQRVKALESQFGGVEGWNSGDVEIFRTAEGEVYRIKDAVLFDSGSAVVKPAGKKLILEIASQIQSTGKSIRIEGHTDSDPVVKNIKKFPYGNLQLSAARALEVAHLLIAEGKTPAEKISIAGFGSYRPIAPNNSASNKRKNRRVEIVVLDLGT